MPAVEMAADPNVVVVAWADEAYTQRKFEGGRPRVESYVFMQGRRFDGTTHDESLSRLTFRKIVETLAVQIADQNYIPTRDVKSADLLLVVHWGVTEPHVSMDDLRGTTNTGVDPHAVEQAAAMSQIRAPGDPNVADDPANAFFVDSGEPYRDYAFDQAERISDGFEANFRKTSNADLLGYTMRLRTMSGDPVMSTKEEMLRMDLHTERYFIIVHAYDLKAPTVNGVTKRPVWRLYLNMRSPGQNFQTAVARMSDVARQYAGRNLEDIETVRPGEPTGNVEIGDVKIIGVVGN